MIIFNWLLGISLDFANVMFKSWLAERDISSIVAALKKAQIENKLLVCIWFNDLLKTLHIHVFKFIFCKFLMLHVVSVYSSVTMWICLGFRQYFVLSSQELFPVNKRDQDTFVAHFKKVGLAPIADFQVKFNCVNKVNNFVLLEFSVLCRNSFYFILGHSEK